MSCATSIALNPTRRPQPARGNFLFLCQDKATFGPYNNSHISFEGYLSNCDTNEGNQK